jgi:hypothetical protein
MVEEAGVAFVNQEDVVELVGNDRDENEGKDGDDDYDKNVVHKCVSFLLFRRNAGSKPALRRSGAGDRRRVAGESRKFSGSRKAAFGLRLRAGLTAPNRVWDLNPWFPLVRLCALRRNHIRVSNRPMRRTSPAKSRMAAGMIQIEHVLHGYGWD